MLCNDMPPITPCDMALKNRVCSIPHTKSFVNKPQSECNEYEMEADPRLKDKIGTPDWIDAFFWIIMDAYNNGIRMSDPDDVKEESDELFVVEDKKIKSLLAEQYEFVSTDDKDSYVPFRILSRYLTDEGIRMSDTKLGRELKSIGLKSNDNLRNMFKNTFFNFLYKDILYDS
jgi:hypothetical protein